MILVATTLLGAAIAVHEYPQTTCTQIHTCVSVKVYFQKLLEYQILPASCTLHFCSRMIIMPDMLTGIVQMCMHLLKLSNITKVYVFYHRLEMLDSSY
jgi:hypothetical protein